MKTYWGDNFFQFFQTMAIRFIDVITGRIPLAADEIQILVLSCIAISFGLIGPFLVLKRMTMLANSLSHTIILLGLVLSFLVCRALFHQSEPFICRVFSSARSPLLFSPFSSPALSLAICGCRKMRALDWCSLRSSRWAFRRHALYARRPSRRRSCHGQCRCAADRRFETRRRDGRFERRSTSSVYSGRCNARHSTAPFPARRVYRALFSTTCSFFSRQPIALPLSAPSEFFVCILFVGPYLAARICNDRLSRLLVLTPLFGILASVFGVALARHILTVSGVALSTGRPRLRLHRFHVRFSSSGDAR